MSQGVRAGISRREQRFEKEHLMPAPKADDAKYIACANIVPDCTFTATAATEEELIKQVAAHAAHDHGITEVTPELVEKVKSVIETR